ncbi:WYL domain-containing protein [Streptomyces sp. V4-01]|uniref:WYL domain-containing protein n=1 Tax=Actinacidiphila polyblastidii TaxID=3110430 RepID=A0ABU7P5V0_9ACTN|nr:WYL domain-containing protein [Streptomyces sp. V4-01]
MKLTKNQTTEQTLAAMYRATARRHPVTITYIKADGTETLRTIELADIRTTKAGDIILRAADRQTGELRTFRLDRIQAYTIHRTAYTVALPETGAPARALPATSSPAAVVAYELGRDDRPARRQLTPAA